MKLDLYSTFPFESGLLHCSVCPPVLQHASECLRKQPSAGEPSQEPISVPGTALNYQSPIKLKHEQIALVGLSSFCQEEIQNRRLSLITAVAEYSVWYNNISASESTKSLQYFCYKSVKHEFTSLVYI